MTNILLTIIIVLLFARLVLMINQGKRVSDRTYVSSYGVRKVVLSANTIEELSERLCEKWWYCDYELVSIIKDKDEFYAFLQLRKIKNYMEE